jgi:Zn-dependent protease
LILLGLPPILAAKPVPFNPMRVKWDEFGAALIGLAGPFTNLVLACVSAVTLRLMDFSANLPLGFYDWPEKAAYTFMVINLGYFVFNMLPLPPLDGSRLLYAVAPEWLQKVMYQIESMGIMFTLVILFVLLPVIGPVIDSLINTLLNLLIA